MTLNELKSQPLAPLLIQQFGYKPIRDKTCKAWPCLKSPNGFKVLVSAMPNPRTGHYLLKLMHSDKWGSIVDALVEIHGHTIPEIINQFTDLPPLRPGAIKELPRPSCIPPEMVTWKLHAYRPTDPNYLTGRGISMDVQRFFNVRSNERGAIFPLFDLENGEWELVTAWTRYNRSFCPCKFLQTPKRGAVTIFGSGKNYETACVFESPIDALSYFELFQPFNTLLISLCGNPSVTQKKGLRAKIAHFGIKKVQICLDNDVAGDKQATALGAYLGGFEISRLKPSGKDWNDDLLKKIP